MSKNKPYNPCQLFKKQIYNNVCRKRNNPRRVDEIILNNI